MTDCLSGAQILVTRPAAQAENLCKMIEGKGGIALRFPTLEIEGLVPDIDQVKNAWSGDWLIFTSKNAVDFARKAFDGKMAGFHGPRIAAVGAATAHAVRQAGWQVDCVPASEFNSEGLLAEAPMHDVAGKRCAIVRGVGGREKLAETLRCRGAEVSYLEVYRRQRPSVDNGVVAEPLRQQQLAAATVTSEEALRNLLAMLDHDSAALLKKRPLLVVSDRIRQTARELGFETVAVSPQPTDTAILETLTTLLSGENSG